MLNRHSRRRHQRSRWFLLKVALRADRRCRGLIRCKGLLQPLDVGSQLRLIGISLGNPSQSRHGRVNLETTATINGGATA